MDESFAYYSARVDQFLLDAESGKCLDYLKAAIPNEERAARSSEIRSWGANIKAIKQLLKSSRIYDAYIAFELFVPLCEKRIDCALFGKDSDGRANMTIIELKQWSNDRLMYAQDNCNYELNEEGTRQLSTIISGRNTILIHPCEQSKTYQSRVKTSLKSVIDGKLSVDAFAYCYNYSKKGRNILGNQRYNGVIREITLYYSEDSSKVAERLSLRFQGGMGEECYDLLADGYAEPSGFQSRAGELLDENSFLTEFEHNSDQGIAERGIISSVRAMISNPNKKQVFFVQGGPGTGKTIVGLRLLCQFIKLNKNPGCQYIFHPMYMVRSKAMRDFIESAVGEDFQNRYITSGILSHNFPRQNGQTLRIVFYDECHRLCEEKDPEAAVNSLLDNFEIIVFLLDERQTIAGKHRSPNLLIEEVIRSRSDTEIKARYHLYTQMRCDSSREYVEWIDLLLYNEKTHLGKAINYDFRICDSAMEMKRRIDEKISEGIDSRICAGYCWPWHKSLADEQNGVLFNDIVIDDFAMPWNTHENIRPLPRGYVKKEQWAFKPEGTNQVGCIYTTQGLEFGYIGVIVGPDLSVKDGNLITRPDEHTIQGYCERNRMVTSPANCEDDVLFNKSMPDLKDRFIRNIYRVLLTRGMKGCFVYFCNPEVRKYVECRLPKFIKG